MPTLLSPEIDALESNRIFMLLNTSAFMMHSTTTPFEVNGGPVYQFIAALYGVARMEHGKARFEEVIRTQRRSGAGVSFRGDISLARACTRLRAVGEAANADDLTGIGQRGFGRPHFDATIAEVLWLEHKNPTRAIVGVGGGGESE